MRVFVCVLTATPSRDENHVHGNRRDHDRAENQHRQPAHGESDHGAPGRRESDDYECDVCSSLALYVGNGRRGLTLK